MQSSGYGCIMLSSDHKLPNYNLSLVGGHLPNIIPANFSATKPVVMYNIKSAKERVARVRACNYIKFKTGQNLPLVLKIVTRPGLT